MSDFDFAVMHMEAVERHLEYVDRVVACIAEGGTTLDVMRVTFDMLDGMDALTDSDEAPLRSAWLAAGGADDDYPVVTLTFPASPVAPPVSREAQ